MSTPKMPTIVKCLFQRYKGGSESSVIGVRDERLLYYTLIERATFLLNNARIRNRRLERNLG